MTLSLLKAANIAAPHGFTTRLGGVSETVYTSLNLGLSTGDDKAKVAENRERVLQHFGKTKRQACVLDQVHSAVVVSAAPSWYSLKADAVVTDRSDLLLIVSMADCLPLLFYDAKKQLIAAAHAGWRGTLAGIAFNVIAKLRELYASNPKDVQVAMGPGIQGGCYQVGPEVVSEFAEAFPETVYSPDAEGKFLLDLPAANRYMLTKAGVPQENILSLGVCTHCDQEQFFSHRRDDMQRGSHWAAICLKV